MLPRDSETVPEKQVPGTFVTDQDLPSQYVSVVICNTQRVSCTQLGLLWHVLLSQFPAAAENEDNGRHSREQRDNEEREGEEEGDRGGGDDDDSNNDNNDDDHHHHQDDDEPEEQERDGSGLQSPPPAGCGAVFSAGCDCLLDPPAGDGTQCGRGSDGDVH